jgi:phosphoglycolate phosphatase
MRHTPRTALLCADLIAILAGGGAEVDKAFAEALGTQGIVPGTTAYARCMVQVHHASGQAEIEIFRGMFPGDEARAQAASLAFTRSFAGSIERGLLSPVPGADAALDKLTGAGIQVCLVSGFSRQLSAQALRAFSWHDRLDLLVSADDCPRCCPWPDPVLTAMLRLGTADVREATVAGGTDSMVRSGCRAGAGLVAGVLSGPHSEARLTAAGATRLIATVAELPELLISQG